MIFHLWKAGENRLNEAASSKIISQHYFLRNASPSNFIPPHPDCMKLRMF